MSKRKTTEEFIEESRKVHGDKYDYSKVKYLNNRTKVCIICPEHGEFWQTPSCHLKGNGCDGCAHIKTWDTRGRIDNEKFKCSIVKKYGNKYDLSKVEYNGSSKKVCIICHEKDEFGIEHGEFWISPENLLHKTNPKSCTKCSKRKRLDNEYFVERSKLVHGDKYIYEKTDVNSRDYMGKVIITCPIHGDFLQKPSAHIKGAGCPKCYGNVKRTTKEFIDNAVKVHGNSYSYDKSVYINNNVKLTITCPIHGDFEQTPIKHINGKHGCPFCSSSHLEKEIMTLLVENGILYKFRERKLPWTKGLELDFYLPEHNIAIECQGIQHFEPKDVFGGEKEFKSIIKRDKLKSELCKNNNVKLLYYSNLNIEYPYYVFEDKNKLLNEILKKNEK